MFVLVRLMLRFPDLLERTITHSENNSSLVVGPRGCGKSLLVRHILNSLQYKYQNSKGNCTKFKCSKQSLTAKVQDRVVGQMI